MNAAAVLPHLPAWKRTLRSEYAILWLNLAYFGVFASFTPAMATTGNFQNMLTSMLPLLVVALGQTVVLISGGIDLSVTAVIGLASVTGAQIMSADSGLLAGHPLATPAAIAAMLTVGSLVGAFNGAAVTLGRMPAFMVTLTAMMFVSGLAEWQTQSQAVSGLPRSFTLLGGSLGPALALTAAAALGVDLFLRRTRYGHWLYAAGHNPQAARISGVPVAGVTWAAYILSGLCAAAASILYTGQTETGSPVLGEQILLDVIGATVIGGTSLFGGKGKVVWTVGGVVLLKQIDNSLNLLSLSSFAIMMVKGAVILLAALLDTVRHRPAASRV